MVEYKSQLDQLFYCLSDPTRRDILERLKNQHFPISAIAIDYDMSLAAVSKHIKILQTAGLVSKKRQGRQWIATAEISKLDLCYKYIKHIKNEEATEVASSHV